MPYPNAPRFTPTITGTVYYVSTSGNDNNPGTLASPFATIGKGISMVSPGGAVYIRGGTYNVGPGSLYIGKSGTSLTSMINLIAYTGETPIIEGLYSTSLGMYDALVNLAGNYIYLEGIEVRNSNGMGVYMGGHHNIVHGGKSHDHKTNGILIAGDYGIVEHSQVYRACMSNEGGGQGTWASGLTAARNPVGGITHNAIIRYNSVSEIWGEALSTYEADGTLIEGNIVGLGYSACLYVSDATNVKVKSNFVYGDPASPVWNSTGAANVGIMIGDETYDPISSDNTFINNIVYHTERNFYYFNSPSDGGHLTNVLIANNTFVDSTYLWTVQISAPANGSIQTGPHVNTVYRNNITIQTDSLPVGYFGSTAGGVTYDHNAWSKTAPTVAQGAGDRTGDPLLVKTGSPFGDPWTSHYYDLQSASPVINVGATIASITDDFYGNARGPSYDMGAVEYIVAEPPPPPPPDPPPPPPGGGNVSRQGAVESDLRRVAIGSESRKVGAEYN